MKKLLLLFFIAPVLASMAQQTDAVLFSKQITADDLRANLSILASDALEGRQTGTRGQKMAAAFIAHHFESLGLQGPIQGSYLQPFNLYSQKRGSISVVHKGKIYANGQEVVFYGDAASGQNMGGNVVFVGKGSPEEVAQVSVAGKIAMFTSEGMSFSNLRKQSAALREAGAMLVMVCLLSSPQEFADFASQMTNFSGGLSLTPSASGQSRGGAFFVSEAFGRALFGDALRSPKTKLDKVKPAPITYSIELIPETIKTENVLGFLEGTDKKDEVLVITAHFDHIGLEPDGRPGDRINNGADDDGSGTVAVMQLAQAFAEAKKAGKGPRRSMLFMTVSAEEVGLYGSQYYTDIAPVFPLDKTVANLNIDMVGRKDEAHATTPDYVYIIGSDKLSSELHEINERNNQQQTQLVFDYLYNDENHPTNLYKRSDHWNFAKHNIPIIFYFDGIHEDYHKPTDEVGKIDFDLLAKRTRCVFFTAWEIANRDERLKVKQ